MGSEIKKSPIILSNGIRNKNRSMEKRISYIANYKKQKAPIWLKVCLIVTSMLALFLATTFYQSIPSCNEVITGNIYIQPISEYDVVMAQEDPAFHLPLNRYEGIFSDESENLYFEDSVSELVECDHELTDGYYYQHSKKDNDSCETKTYRANRCGQCTVVYISELTNQSDYSNCKHN